MRRRDFIKTGSIAAMGTLILPDSVFSGTLFRSKVNIGVIGTGLRGQSHLNGFLQRDDVQVKAIADPSKRMVKRTLDLFKKYDKPKPKVYADGDYDYRKLLKRDDIDAVVIASPWKWHYPQAIEAMKAGKITGLEVCGAMNLEQCWGYVKTYEETGVPIFMMENVCYRRDVMAVFNMVRQGKFGQLIHARGGYQHDLRRVLFNDGVHAYGHGVKFGEEAFSEAKWRTLNHIDRNAELYPTHGLGPVATMLDVNRGNRITHLTSMASTSIGLHDYVTKQAGPDTRAAQTNFKQGDVVTTMLKCENGQSIELTLNTTTQRPYNIGFRVQGTDGIWQEYGWGDFEQGHLYFEQEMDYSDRWANSKEYLTKYDHPLWKRFEKRAKGAGHGGMDFFLRNDFVECIKANKAFPFDVYDLATWYAVTPLSAKSIEENSSSQKMPDFTQGKYKTRKPIFGFPKYDAEL